MRRVCFSDNLRKMKTRLLPLVAALSVAFSLAPAHAQQKPAVYPNHVAKTLEVGGELIEHGGIMRRQI